MLREEYEKAWNSIADEVAEQLKQNKTIAFLSLGDVSLYSTWGYLRSKLQARGFDSESIPGVTAMSAVAAKLDRDLTERDQSLTIIPASVTDDVLETLLNAPGSKVIMKSGRSLNLMLEKLEDKGLLSNSAMVINCGLPGEKIYRNLENTTDAKGYFATVLVKKD